MCASFAPECWGRICTRTVSGLHSPSTRAATGPTEFRPLGVVSVPRTTLHVTYSPLHCSSQNGAVPSTCARRRIITLSKTWLCTTPTGNTARVKVTPVAIVTVNRTVSFVASLSLCSTAYMATAAPSMFRNWIRAISVSPFWSAATSYAAGGKVGPVRITAVNWAKFEVTHFNLKWGAQPCTAFASIKRRWIRTCSVSTSHSATTNWTTRCKLWPRRVKTIYGTRICIASGYLMKGAWTVEAAVLGTRIGARARSVGSAITAWYRTCTVVTPGREAPIHYIIWKKKNIFVSRLANQTFSCFFLQLYLYFFFTLLVIAYITFYLPN